LEFVFLHNTVGDFQNNGITLDQEL